MTPAILEIRYRRLLRWYPAEHRAVHHDEMLGVLMAGAESGRSRPGLRDSADLLLGAARIRLRPGRALSDGSGWRDALAVYSFAAPLLVLTSTLLGLLAAELEARHLGLAGFTSMVSGIYISTRLLVITAIWVTVGGQVLVAVLVLLGLRRWAAAAAAISALYLGINAVLHLYTALSVGIPISLLYIPFVLMAPITETVALLASPGPRRGRQLMRRRGWAMLAAGSITAAALTPDFGFVLYNLGGETLHQTAVLMAGFFAALLLLVLWLSSAQGKRVALLFAVLFYGLLLMDRLIDESGPWGTATITGGLGQVLVILLLAAVIFQTWRRSRSPAGGSGEGVA
jgi:hypothetical protein